MKALESTDLLKGSIWKSILIFSLPLLVGNLFQQLYNTVDSYVVGNFVSSHALAAVGQSTSIINMLVGFFMGLSTGAGVVIAQYFGAKETKKMQDSIHTSLALTLVLCVLFTILGIALSKPILVMIGSPKEVLPLAVIYLQIYFAGVSFSLIYNMGAGILRALGDSKKSIDLLSCIQFSEYCSRLCVCDLLSFRCCWCGYCDNFGTARFSHSSYVRVNTYR